MGVPTSLTPVAPDGPVNPLLTVERWTMTFLRTLKKRAGLVATSVGALMTAVDVAIMTAPPLGERLLFSCHMGFQAGFVTYIGLNAPVKGKLRLALFANVVISVLYVIGLLTWTHF